MLDFDLAYSHSYEVEELKEFPGMGKLDLPVFYIPLPKSRPEHDGLWLKIRPATGETWVGVFAFGYDSPPAFSRVISSPDPDRLCIISKGAAYIVKANKPETWEKVPTLPVLDVRPIPEYQLLVFADFTGLAAYGRSGMVWRSTRVCWDGLKILSVTHDSIVGVGCNPMNFGESKFAVDIRTGRSLLPSPGTHDGKPV